MSESAHLVLLAGIDRSFLEEEGPFLRRLKVQAHFARKPAAAVPLVAENPYDLMMLGYPMRDLQLQPFLAAVRGKESPCRSAGIILLAEPEHLEEARKLIGRGVNRVVPASGAAEAFERAVSELANVAPRRSMRTPVRMEVHLGTGRQRMLCQTENVSATGMLLRGAQGFPVGATMAFELTLPETGTTLRGDAEVVRHTTNKEGVRGFAVRFLSLADDGPERIAEFLDTTR